MLVIEDVNSCRRRASSEEVAAMLQGIRERLAREPTFSTPVGYGCNPGLDYTDPMGILTTGPGIWQMVRPHAELVFCVCLPPDLLKKADFG